MMKNETESFECLAGLIGDLGADCLEFDFDSAASYAEICSDPCLDSYLTAVANYGECMGGSTPSTIADSFDLSCTTNADGDNCIDLFGTTDFEASDFDFCQFLEDIGVCTAVGLELEALATEAPPESESLDYLLSECGSEYNFITTLPDVDSATGRIPAVAISAAFLMAF
jgi:hypothetical protein